MKPSSPFQRPRGEVVGGVARGWEAATQGKGRRSPFPEMNSQPSEPELGEHRVGRNLLLPQSQAPVKAPWGLSCRPHQAPNSQVWARDCLVLSSQARTPDILLRGPESINPRCIRQQPGRSGPRRVTLPFQKKRLLSSAPVFCSRAETDPAQGPQGPWGKQPGFLQEPSALPRTFGGKFDVGHSCKGPSFSLTPQREALPSPVSGEGDDGQRGQRLAWWKEGGSSRTPVTTGSMLCFKTGVHIEIPRCQPAVWPGHQTHFPLFASLRHYLRHREGQESFPETRHLIH